MTDQYIKKQDLVDELESNTSDDTITKQKSNNKSEAERRVFNKIVWRFMPLAAIITFLQVNKNIF